MILNWLSCAFFFSFKGSFNWAFFFSFLKVIGGLFSDCQQRVGERMRCSVCLSAPARDWRNAKLLFESTMFFELCNRGRQSVELCAQPLMINRRCGPDACSASSFSYLLLWHMSFFFSGSWMAYSQSSISLFLFSCPFTFLFLHLFFFGLWCEHTWHRLRAWATRLTFYLISFFFFKSHTELRPILRTRRGHLSKQR